MRYATSITRARRLCNAHIMHYIPEAIWLNIALSSRACAIATSNVLYYTMVRGTGWCTWQFNIVILVFELIYYGFPRDFKEDERERACRASGTKGGEIEQKTNPRQSSAQTLSREDKHFLELDGGWSVPWVYWREARLQHMWRTVHEALRLAPNMPCICDVLILRYHTY
jgi:hypothetical protein